jgi:hypothetical protein
LIINNESEDILQRQNYLNNKNIANEKCNENNLKKYVNTNLKIYTNACSFLINNKY